MSAAVAADTNRRQLERSLAAVQAEREDTHLLLPWVVTAAGAAILVTGLVLGAAASLDCDDSCSSSFWPGWLVIGGGTIGEAGMVWVLLKNRDVAELTSRERQIETEIERLQWNAQPAAVSPRAALTLRRSF